MRTGDPIGGYFELELRDEGSPYPHALPVNNGRAGLELIVKVRNYTHVYLPEYICPVVFEKLNQMGVRWTAYDIDENLDPPHILPKLQKTDGFLYVNYFGVKDEYCRQLIRRSKNLILDLTQAFFFVPPQGADAFNSVRKFVGVPDGGFVFGDFAAKPDLPRATSWQYCEHLLRRLDNDVSGGYETFKKNDLAMRDWSPMRMSLITERLLRAIDFERVRRKRIENFCYLHNVLKGSNRLAFELASDSVPLCYPYLSENGVEITKVLIKNKVFVPTYWPSIEEYLPVTEVVRAFQQNLVCLPIDQRYGLEDMAYMLSFFEKGGGE